MAELSQRSGVVVATIKYYQRENLLHAGILSSPTQASYDESHVERLRLIRALIEVGGLSVSSAREVLSAIDDTEMPLTWAFGVAQRAMANSASGPAPSTGGPGARELARALEDAGVFVHDDNPGLPIAARVLDSYSQLGHDELFETVREYLRAALIVAGADLDAVASGRSREEMANTVVVGTVLGDSLSAALRRIAQEHVSRQKFPLPEGAQS